MYVCVCLLEALVLFDDEPKYAWYKRHVKVLNKNETFWSCLVADLINGFCFFRRSFPSFYICTTFFFSRDAHWITEQKKALMNNLIKNFLFHGLKQQFFICFANAQCSSSWRSSSLLFLTAFEFHNTHSAWPSVYSIFHSIKLQNSTSRCNLLMNMYLKQVCCSLSQFALVR